MSVASEPRVGSPDEAASTRPHVLARLKSALRGRPDREHEIAFNRIVIAGAGLAYLNASRLFGFHAWTRGAYWLDAYLVVYALGLTAHLLAVPSVSPARRVVGAVCDLLAIALFVHMGDDITALLYPFFLWAIFGNGFRFGVRYLYVATVVAVVLFAATVVTTPFWRVHWSVSVGLLAGLVILPVYVSVLIRQLSEAKRVAEEANKAKTLFLASVSHELRTPLNAIIGLSDLLSDSRLSEDQADMSRVIGRSGRSLLSLINSILETSRMQAGYPLAKPDDVDLHAFLADLRDMLAVQGQAKNVRVALHIAPDTPRFATFNARHVEEVLVNLAGNAIKFTERGFVLIAVDAIALDATTSRLRVEVTDTGIGIRPEAIGRIFERFTQADASIIDRFGGTGLGLTIAKQLIEGMGGRIGVESEIGAGSTFWFDLPCETPAREPAAWRSDGVYVLSRDANVRALATDLFPDVAIAADEATLVAALSAGRAAGGRNLVAIVDACGSGAEVAAFIDDIAHRIERFDVAIVGLFAALDRRDSRRVLSRVASSIVAPVQAPSLARAVGVAMIGRRKENARTAILAATRTHTALNVLVAEDNRTNQMVIRKILERAGHRVTLVSDGQSAIERLSEEKFDLAFMDINMPVLNGVDAAKLYQFTSPDAQRTPIAALTADATAEMERRCLDAGMIACIVKPIEAERLIAWLDAFAEARAPTVAPEVEEAPAAEDIAAHDAPIDDRAISDLQSLGGDQFVAEIVDQFLGDAAAMLRRLHAAVEDGDVQGFRDEAHALRSCAANVGAQQVYKLCLDWREIGARDLAIDGETRVHRLEREFERARDALADVRRRPDAA